MLTHQNFLSKPTIDDDAAHRYQQTAMDSERNVNIVESHGWLMDFMMSCILEWCDEPKDWTMYNWWKEIVDRVPWSGLLLRADKGIIDELQLVSK
eukprot:1370618-Amphidinium_carterae.1